MALPGGCLVKQSLARDLVGEKEGWKKKREKNRKTLAHVLVAIIVMSNCRWTKFVACRVGCCKMFCKNGPIRFTMKRSRKKLERDTAIELLPCGN